jgi:hypothetical protein
MTKHHDLAIRWNDKKSSLSKLIQAGSVSIHGFPHFFRVGNWVAIVCKGNQIRLLFKARKIEGPKKVKLANGKVGEKGYIIRTDKKTMQELEPSISSPIRGWFALGAFRYFNKTTMKPVLVGPIPSSRDIYIEDHTEKVAGTVFRKHTVGIPGMPHRHPESILVEQYVQWLGEGVRFGHNYIQASHLFVDLFDLTHWQLLEAKIATNRETIRMAIGQLRDYKRFYDRSPTLAVLLPSRPSDSCMDLPTDNHISVIWKNRRGSFNTRKWQS